MAASSVQIVTCLSLVAQIKSQSFDCPQTGNPSGLPFFQSYRNDEIQRYHQAIIPSYQLVCDQYCGNITGWGADLQPGGAKFDMEYTIDFQVWRPSPTVDDSTGTGCYSLVGNNRFTSISLSDNLARVTPSTQDYIQFRPGDVLGFYVEEARDPNGGVVVLTDPSNFTSELVWYASIAPTMAASQNGDCPYSVGSNGVLNTLTRAAPVISVSIVTFPCPSLPSAITIQSTPPPGNGEDNNREQMPEEQVTLPDNIGSSRPDTEVRVPTTSETAIDLRSQGGPSNIGLIVGIVVIVVCIIVTLSGITVTVLFIVAFLLKKRHAKFTTTAVTTAANQAHGLNTHEGVEESIYDYPGPEINADNTIEAKQNVAYVTNTDVIVEVNEAYATRIVTEGNEAYATNIITVGNEAYAGSIITEGNQAYATISNITTEENQAYSTSIATEKNAIYESVTTTDYETANVYEIVN